MIYVLVEVGRSIRNVAVKKSKWEWFLAYRYRAIQRKARFSRRKNRRNKGVSLT